MTWMNTVRQPAQSLLAGFIQPAILPVIVYLCAYLGTNVLGAAVLLTEFGESQAKIFLPDFNPALMPTFGSPLYLTILFAPLLIVPAFVLAGIWAGDRAIHWLPQFRIADPSTGVLYALMAIFAGWCFYKIATTGYIFPELLLDRSKLCDDRIIRRVELFVRLRYIFYASAYSMLPMISTMFLVKGIQDRKALDLVGFGLSFLVIVYLYASIYMKTPFIIYFMMLLVGTLIIGLRWWKALATIGGLAGAIFVASTLALDCTDHRVIATTISPSTIVRSAPAGGASSQTPATGVPSSVTEPAPNSPLVGATPWSVSEAAPTSPLVATTLPIARNLVFRMAIAFPYYVDIFDDPAERCGVEDNRMPILPKQACFPASKVFSAMYPKLNYVQGQAPAAAHVSALAELGPWFSFLVMIASGLAIGITIQFARLCEPILAASTIAAIAVFAYNLTQVPFVGALTYSQGLVVLLFPIALSVTIQHVWPALSRSVLVLIGRRAAIVASAPPSKSRSVQGWRESSTSSRSVW